MPNSKQFDDDDGVLIKLAAELKEHQLIPKSGIKFQAKDHIWTQITKNFSSGNYMGELQDEIRDLIAEEKYTESLEVAIILDKFIMTNIDQTDRCMARSTHLYTF